MSPRSSKLQLQIGAFVSFAEDVGEGSWGMLVWAAKVRRVVKKETLSGSYWKTWCLFGLRLKLREVPAVVIELGREVWNRS